MNALWSYFWPAFAAGLLTGTVAGIIAFRRRRGNKAILAGGIGCAIALAALWHGPFGAADRFTARVERGAQQALQYYEMTKVTAHLHRHPLTRSLIFAGPADDFQRGELVRLFEQLPGVREAGWSEDRAGLPLIVEGALLSILGFLFGLLLAYLVDLHRRYNAQWNW